jgi:hypothetical protein
MSNQRQQTFFRILALVALLNIIISGRGLPAQTRTTMAPIFAPVDISADLQTLADNERQALAGELMTIQARGDYEGATLMLETLGVVRPEAQEVLKRLSNVPVDIEPHYSTAESLRGIR